MSFLDNLENTLKSLESRDERDPIGQDRRDAERAKALAAAPWAERLKTSSYTQELLNHATRVSYELRAKVYMAWIGSTLRLDLRDRRLELRPTPEGIAAVFIENNTEVRKRVVTLTEKPEELIQDWLSKAA